MITRFLRRLPRAVKRHGVIGALRVAAEQARGLATTLRPSVRGRIREHQKRADEFDKQFGVDTAGFIHPTELRLDSPNQLHAVSYKGSDPTDFRNAIAALPIDYTHFVLVDFGSGKGRAILLASEFPFKRIVGVEFSEELHNVAQDNISRFQRNACKCETIESICMDAIDYSLPDEPLVCYFCNPFDVTLMAHVVANIRESLRRKPREIFIVYYNPKEGHLFDRTDCFRPVGTSGSVRIWRTIPEPNTMRTDSLC